MRIIWAFFLMILTALPVHGVLPAQEFYAEANALLRKLDGKLYSLSQDRMAESDFEQAFSQAKTEFELLLSNEDVTFDSVLQYAWFHPHGDSLLHVFALNGYYPLVEMMLNDEGLAQLKEQKNAFGMLPYDLARAKFNQYFVISYPEQMCDSFSFVPLSVKAESFYDSPIEPYSKTIALLGVNEASSNARISSVYIHFLEHRQKILLKGSSYPTSVNDAVRAQFNKHILELRKINNLEEGEFLIKLNDIQKSLLTDIDNSSPYRHINRKNLMEYCKMVR